MPPPRFKRLLVNKYEQATFDQIQGTVERFGLTVWVKVGLKDVLPIENSRLEGDLYRYALMAHFDFVVCRDMEVEYAVEFDGPGHQVGRAAANDEKKDAICDRFQFPVLRIDARHLETRAEKLSMLAWILEVRELEICFEEAQRKGQVAYDEPFDPFSIWSFGDRSHPYCLAHETRLKWRRLHARGLIQDTTSNGGLWRDEKNTVFGIEFIRVTATHGLHVASWMRLQRFPEMMSLFEEILCLRLDDALTRYLAGRRKLEPLEGIAEKIDCFNTKYRVGRCHFSNGPDLTPMPLGIRLFGLGDKESSQD